MILDSDDLQAMRQCCRDDAAFEQLQTILARLLPQMNLQRSDQRCSRYEAILDALPDRVFLVNRNGDNLDFKGTQEDSENGITPETVIGTNLRQFVPPDVAQLCLQAIAKTLDSKTLQTFEYQIPKAWEPNFGELRDYELRLVVSGENEVLVIERDITDRKREEAEHRQVEERLRQAESEYRGIFEAISDGLVISDAETGRVVEANPACCQMHGYTYNEFLGLLPEAIIHPDSFHLFQEYITSINAGKPFRRRAIDLRKDGSSFHVEVLGTSFNYQGKPHLLGVLRDISEQVQAETALRESEGRNRALVDAIPDSMFRISEDGVCLDVKASREGELILPPARFLGKNLQAVLPQEVGQQWMEHIQQALQTGQVQSFEYQIAINGSVRDREARIVVCGEREVVAIMRDITDRKRAERVSDRERRLFAGGPVTVFRWSAQVHRPVEYVSANVIQFGYRPEEFTSGRICYTDIIHPNDLPRIIIESRDYIDSGALTYEQDYRIVRADGEIRWIYDFSSVVCNAQGIVTHCEGYILDITERKRSEEALRESEEKFSKIFHCSPAALTLITIHNTQLIDINDSFSRMTGYQRDEVVGYPVQNLKLWLDESICEQIWHALETQGTIRNQEVEFHRKSGEVGVVLLSAEIINVRGERCVLGVMSDITERKQAQAALQQSEARNRAFLNAIPDLMFRITREGMYLDFKADKAADFAIPPEHMLGKSVYEVLPPEVAKQRMKYVQRTLETSEIQVYEYQLPRRGELRDYEARIVASGQDEVLAIMRDITERKQAEAQLQANVDRDRLLGQIALRIRRSLNLDQILTTTVEEVQEFLHADRVFIGQIGSDLQGRILAEAVAPEWGSILTWIVNDIYLREIRTLFEQGQVLVIDNTNQANLSPLMAEYYHRCHIRASIGVPIILGDEFFGVLVVNQCDQPRHWSPFEVELLSQLANQVAIAIQQAELYQQVQSFAASLERQVQERTAQLQQKMQELQELNQIKDDFLHAVSHDLRTPVMGMSMVLKNLQNKSGDMVTVSRSVLDRMVQSCDRQLAMINSLLEAHSSEVQGIDVHSERVNMGELVRLIADDLDPLITSNQAILSNLVSLDLPPVTADPALIRRVFENLLTNALKHNPPDLHLTIQATIADEMIRCSVQDDGIGMTQSECDSLFERYARGVRARRSTGIGLGLYLCRQIVTAHGGQIGAISAPGAGATFWFTLPLVSV